MAKQGRKSKIKIKERVSVQRKDKTDVAKPDTTKYRKAPFIMNDNGLNMRIKIKRKSR